MDEHSHLNEPPASLSLRRLLGSPAYRLGAGHKWRRGLGAGIWLLVLSAIWIGSAIPMMSAAHTDFGEAILLLLGRVLGVPLFLLGTCIHGALAFAPERRMGTADQFVLLPLPTREKLLARTLAATVPMLPALILVTLADLAMGILSPNLDLDNDFMIYGAVMAAVLSSTALLVFSLGLWSSLRAGTASRAVGLALLLGTAAVGTEVGAWIACSAILDHASVDEWVGIAFAIAAALAHIAAAVIVARRVFRSCLRHMDEWLAGER